MTHCRLPLAVASLILTAALLAGGSASAFEAKHTQSGKPVRWGADTVELVLSPSIDAIAPGAREALESALSGWAGASHAPKLVLRTGTADLKPAYDGTNLVYYAPDGFAPAGSALAVTVLSFDDATGEILDADIIINGRRGLEVLPGSAVADVDAHAVSTEGGSEGGSDDEHVGEAFDLEHVFAHEAGHLLGLNDEPANAKALMYPFTMPGDASMRLPSDDDIAGIAESYSGPSPAASAGHGGCATSGGSSASSRAALLGTLAMLIVIALRACLSSSRGQN